jgi:sec-independent protein translocase protein TatC
MLPFFIETNLFLGLDNLWNLNNVVVSGIGLSLVLGFCFLFPIVLRGLIKIGFVDKVFLKSKRGFVVVGLLLVSGLVTPTPDVLSQLVVALPLYILFELSLL